MKDIDTQDNRNIMDDSAFDALISDALVRRDTLARIEKSVAADVRRIHRRRMAVMWCRVAAFSFAVPAIIFAFGFCTYYILATQPHSAIIYAGTAMFAACGIAIAERAISTFRLFGGERV